MVLLTHGYFLHEDPKERAIMKPYPPLGILYLSAWLDRHGVANAVFDTTFSSREILQQHLLAQRPGIAALYTNLMTKLNVIAIMRFIRSQQALQHTRIVLGGPDVTHNAAEYLGAGADILVIGEGEQTLLELVHAMHATPAWRTPHAVFSAISGLAYRLPDGSVHRTAAREKLRDLDDLPLPNRQKIDLQSYLDAWKHAHGHSAMTISTQRGCPYTCRWCSTAVYGQSYRRRSPKAVADEIEWLQAHYDIDLIWFVDDVFTVSHKWLEGFHAELRQRGIRAPFECITRADRLNEPAIALLRDCGCFRVWIGAESGSQRIIDAMDRRVDVQQVRAMIQAARRAGIQAGTFIMLGYPGETESDIRATVEHLKTSNPDLFTITVAYPIKGTGLYEEVASTAFSDLPWADRTDRDLDFRRSYPRRYYDFAVRWTVNAVHWHKAKLAGRWYFSWGWLFWAKMWVARGGMWWWRLVGQDVFPTRQTGQDSQDFAG
ncbi:MAG: B12-binding domain-containing radical SAM protein [Saprospirales bacterium]|nr:B12-binding domain-containing radical SAM protein [Saprospirales bacterium]